MLQIYNAKKHLIRLSCFLITCIALVAVGTPAKAVIISAQNSTWDLLSQSTHEQTIHIANAGGPVDFTGWQLSLRITPPLGATGLLFSSFSTPDSGYLLDGNSQGLHSTLTSPTAEIQRASDFVAFLGPPLFFVPVNVPATPTPLLTVGFQAMPGTAGLFTIEMRRFESFPEEGDFISCWSSFGEQISFTNATSSSPMWVAIGSVLVDANSEVSSVPEPSAHVLIAGLAMLITRTMLIKRGRLNEPLDMHRKS